MIYMFIFRVDRVQHSSECAVFHQFVEAHSREDAINRLADIVSQPASTQEFSEFMEICAYRYRAYYSHLQRLINQLRESTESDDVRTEEFSNAIAFLSIQEIHHGIQRWALYGRDDY